MFRIVWSGFFIRWREVASISKEVRKVSYTKIKKIAFDAEGQQMHRPWGWSIP